MKKIMFVILLSLLSVSSYSPAQSGSSVPEPELAPHKAKKTKKARKHKEFAPGAELNTVAEETEKNEVEATAKSAQGSKAKAHGITRPSSPKRK